MYFWNASGMEWKVQSILVIMALLESLGVLGKGPKCKVEIVKGSKCNFKKLQQRRNLPWPNKLSPAPPITEFGGKKLNKRAKGPLGLAQSDPQPTKRIKMAKNSTESNRKLPTVNQFLGQLSVHFGLTNEKRRHQRSWVARDLSFWGFEFGYK